jgi:sugar transferase EpsL
MAKRLFDIVLVLLAIPLFVPVLLAIAALVYVKLGWPVLFSQTRIGLNHEPFTLYKFRSMREGQGSDAERLTPFGKWLRATSLDELPTLFLILTGKMSLVGPRPLLPEYMNYYSNGQKRRHMARPGLTGWAQVNGRNAQRWEDRFQYDVWYVDNQSLWLDIKILFLTVRAVVKREGISAEGHATMPHFGEYMEQKKARQ